MKKILIYLLMSILGLIIAAGIYLQGQKPKYSGKLNIKNLKETVKVYYDHFGVPHIYAKNAHDAYEALGYIHMQDRLFQMEIMRRVANGRLAEILGKDLIPTDKFFRSLGLKEAVKNSIKNCFNPNDSIGKAILAYIDGANQYIENGKTPIEFTLLGIKKEKYTIEDMYMIAGYMAYTFEGGFRIDPLMSKIASKLGKKYLKDIALDYVPGTTKIPVWTGNDSLFAFAEKVNHILENLPSPLLIGSNAWVLSPQKTKSGKVMLSNDTHIGYAQPSVWYEAHIEYPGYSLYGDFLAGIPFSLLGHTRQTAWGITMFENDDLDMYREKRNPKNSQQVWFKDHWENLKVKHEIIKVKGEKNLNFDIKYSRHGVLMNEVLQNLSVTEKNPISVWWEYVQFDSYMFQAFYKINHSTSIRDIGQGAKLIHAPGLNIMAGDVQGNIAWWAAAKMFKRPDHVNSKLILDGSSGKDEIEKFLDFSYNPHAVNPPQGFVYSNNNQPDTIKGMFYPGYYAPEDRAKRVNEYLNTDKKWNLKDMEKMVTNTVSAVHPQTAKLILSFIDKNKLTKTEAEAYKILKNWKGEHLVNSIAPTIFYKILYRSLYNIFDDELGDKDFSQLLGTHLIKKTYPPLFRNDSSVWWDNIKTDAKETRIQIFQKSFHEGIAALEKQLGSNIEAWNWGKVHILEHTHPIGRKKPFDKIFNVGPFHVMGGQQVLNNIDFHLNNSGIYKATYGPAIRNELDFANIEGAESVLPTGESGRLMSKHYDDQAKLYNTGKFRPQLMNKTQIIKDKEGLLILNPIK